MKALYEIYKLTYAKDGKTYTKNVKITESSDLYIETKKEEATGAIFMGLVRVGGKME